MGPHHPGNPGDVSPWASLLRAYREKKTVYYREEDAGSSDPIWTAARLSSFKGPWARVMITIETEREPGRSIIVRDLKRLYLPV